MIVAEKQRAMRHSNKHLQQSIARLIKALEKELASLDTDIDVAVRGSPAWREKEDLLISVPGVGKGTARTLLAVVPELGTLGAREAGSIVGCAPFTRQSGLWKGKSFIGGGRPAARSALFPFGIGGGAAQPADEELLRAACWCWQGKNGRLDRGCS